ncbi:methyltransferase family protein [Luteimonas cucumeris]|uniref:Methyltransferase family protein n=2 Tax=Luteimonas cucumeris TaxID=985012 RepID=A0A562L5N7_9GAMM|nr:methyltransferase family protein [Luteimonas cucumeris]
MYVWFGIAALLGLIALLGYTQYRHVRRLLVHAESAQRQASENLVLVGRLGAEMEGLRSQHQVLDQQLKENQVLAVDGISNSRAAIQLASDNQALVLRSFRDLTVQLAATEQALLQAQAESQQVLLQVHAESQQVLLQAQARSHTDIRASATLGKTAVQEIQSGKKKVETFLASEKRLKEIAYRGFGRLQFETMQEIESLMQLHALFDIRHPTPLLGGAAKGWAMEPVSMLFLTRMVLECRPDLIVECGSGTSTVWIARALAKNGHGRLVSLENSAEYCAVTRSSLRANGLEDWVDLREAPLEQYRLMDDDCLWYSSAAVEGLLGIDLLVVDGPPAATAGMARYPAFPILRGKLSDSAIVILDDAERPDEREIINRWTTECPDLVETAHAAGRLSRLDYRRTR